MRALAGRRALYATAMVLAVTVSGLPARGGEPTMVLRRSVRANWYTARVWLPAGTVYSFDLEMTIARNRGDACVLGYRGMDGEINLAGGGSFGFETQYRRVYVDPRGVSSSLPAVTLIDESRDRPRNSPPFRAYCLGGGGRVDEFKDRTVDLVAFMVSQQPMVDPLIRLRLPPRARVLAESWGLGGTRLLREWDFRDGLVYAGAGELVPPLAAAQARTIVRAARDIRFRRTPVVYFTTGKAFAASTGSWYDPTLLSWARPVGAPNILPPPIIFAGNTGPGTYRFGVEAWGAGWLAALFVFAGKDPYLFLASADADFPACSTLRVRSRARDGHPICG